MLRYEYDSSALTLVRPKSQRFSMLVAPRYREYYEDHEFEAFSSALVARVLGAHRLFVDVGANYGFYTLLAGTRHPGLEIIAFEPVPETYATLRKNVASAGLPQVTLHQAAVSESDGTAAFQISAAADSCGFHTHPAAPLLRQMNVTTVSLDSVLAHREPCSTLVKIDVEGSELAVLRGMAGTLADFPEISFLIEFNPKMQLVAGHEPSALLDELDRLGFAIFLLDDSARLAFRLGLGSAWKRHLAPQSYANLYCVRKERALSVCFFCHSAHLAGAERSLLELTDELVADYGTVCTAVLPGPGPLASRLREAGVAVIESSYSVWCDTGPEPREPFDLDRLAPSAAVLVRRLLPTLERIDPDVITTQTMVIPWGAAAAALLGRPHVWFVSEYGESIHGLHFRVPANEVAREIADSSARIITVAQGVRKVFFPGLRDDQCEVLQPFIPPPDANTASSAGSAFLCPTATRIGMFATFSDGKGQMDAIRAVARLLDSGLDVELLLVGGGAPSFREHLERLVAQIGKAERIRFSGFLENPFPAMREADILLACSRREAFGRSAVEAMLMGKALVYAAAGGYLDYLEDGRTGLAYPPGDDAALADRIARLVGDPELRISLAAAATASARARFSREAYGGRFYRIASALATGKRGAAPMPASIQPLVRTALADLAREAASSEALFGVIRADFEKARARLDLLEREHRQSLSMLATVLGTLSWKMTAPLRSVYCRFAALRSNGSRES